MPDAAAVSISVLDELEVKTDPQDSATLAELADHRLHAAAVSGVNLDVSDTMSTWISIKGWVLSEQGGLRWAWNLALFLGILTASWFAASFASLMTARATSRLAWPSLLRNFLVQAVRWLITWRLPPSERRTTS